MSFLAYYEFYQRATLTDAPQSLTHSYSVNACSSKEGLGKNLVLHHNPYEKKFCRLICKQLKTTPLILLSEPRVLDIKYIFKRQKKNFFLLSSSQHSEDNNTKPLNFVNSRWTGSVPYVRTLMNFKMAPAKILTCNIWDGNWKVI